MYLITNFEEFINERYSDANVYYYGSTLNKLREMNSFADLKFIKDKNNATLNSLMGGDLSHFNEISRNFSERMNRIFRSSIIDGFKEYYNDIQDKPLLICYDPGYDLGSEAIFSNIKKIDVIIKYIDFDKLDSELITKKTNIESIIENISFGDFELSQDELREILNGYLDAAIWTEEERLKEEREGDYDNFDDGDIEDMDDIEKIINKFNIDDFDDFEKESIDVDSRIKAYEDIKQFIKSAGKEAIQEALGEDVKDYFSLGMNIWLTRNGHGAGFFDFNYEYEEDLMRASHELKSVDMYLGDDGLIYFSNSN